MRLLVLLVLSLSLWAQRKPTVELVGVRAHRVGDGKIAVDGRARANADKAIHGLTVVFDFLSADGALLTSLKTQVDDDVVAPGQESAFHGETPTPPGAVKYKLHVFNSADKELRASNTGPFVIEE